MILSARQEHSSETYRIVALATDIEAFRTKPRLGGKAGLARVTYARLMDTDRMDNQHMLTGLVPSIGKRRSLGLASEPRSIVRSITEVRPRKVPPVRVGLSWPVAAGMRCARGEWRPQFRVVGAPLVIPLSKGANETGNRTLILNTKTGEAGEMRKKQCQFNDDQNGDGPSCAYFGCARIGRMSLSGGHVPPG